MPARKGAVDPFRKSGLRNFYDKDLVPEWCKTGFHRVAPRPNFCVRVRNCGLRTMGISGRKHADISADVGIPDIAVGIDSKTVRPSVVARKPECCDPTVAQAAKARTAHHPEPDCPVSGDYQAAKTCVLVRDLEIRKLAILQSADAIGAE